MVTNVPNFSLFVGKVIDSWLEIKWTGGKYKVWQFQDLRTGYKIAMSEPIVRELTDEEKVEYL